MDVNVLLAIEYENARREELMMKEYEKTKCGMLALYDVLCDTLDGWHMIQIYGISAADAENIATNKGYTVLDVVISFDNADSPIKIKNCKYGRH